MVVIPAWIRTFRIRLSQEGAAEFLGHIDMTFMMDSTSQAHIHVAISITEA